jgi:hypothetical protein
MAKMTMTLELEMDFVPSEEIQENILYNVARILHNGGVDSGLISTKMYPENEDETENVIPFIESLTVTGEANEAGLFPTAKSFIGKKETRDLTTP